MFNIIYHKLLEQLSPIERDQVAYTFNQSLTAVLFVNVQPLIGKYNGHKSFAYFTIQIKWNKQKICDQQPSLVSQS